MPRLRQTERERESERYFVIILFTVFLSFLISSIFFQFPFQLAILVFYSSAGILLPGSNFLIYDMGRISGCILMPVATSVDHNLCWRLYQTHMHIFLFSFLFFFFLLNWRWHADAIFSISLYIKTTFIYFFVLSNTSFFLLYTIWKSLIRNPLEKKLFRILGGIFVTIVFVVTVVLVPDIRGG